MIGRVNAMLPGGDMVSSCLPASIRSLQDDPSSRPEPSFVWRSWRYPHAALTANATNAPTISTMMLAINPIAQVKTRTWTPTTRNSALYSVMWLPRATLMSLICPSIPSKRLAIVYQPKRKTPRLYPGGVYRLVAGAGLEPATFGL